MAGTPSPIYGLPTLAGSDPISGTDEYSVALTGAFETLLETQAVLLGLTSNSVKRRGKSIISASGTRTNVAYGALSNGPDEVSGIVLPTDGLLVVAFHTLWSSSVASAGSAAIFLGANQLKRSNSNVTAPAVQEATSGANPGLNATLTSSQRGLISAQNTGVNQSDVTTGQIVGVDTDGGLTIIRAAAGTYTVGVQFKSSSGNVAAFNRSLWVWTAGF